MTAVAVDTRPRSLKSPGASSNNLNGGFLSNNEDSKPSSYPQKDTCSSSSPDFYSESESLSYSYLGSPAASTLTPPIKSRGSRVHHFGRKLAFWRKKPKTASDVHSALASVVKSYDRYRTDLKQATGVMNEWAEYLAPPHVGQSQDLIQHLMTDARLSEWIISVMDTIKPVTDMERKHSEIYSAMVHSFETIKKEEANIKLFLKKQNSAERRYFKAMADEWSEMDTHRLNQERIRLGADVESATEQFRITCRRELPLRFTQIGSCYEQLGLESSQAARILERLLNSTGVSLAMHSMHSQQSFYTSPPPSIPSVSSPSMIVGPLQTSKYPGRGSSHIVSPLTPHSTYESMLPFNEESKQTRTNEELASLSEGNTNTGLGVTGDDFVWN